MRRARDKKRSQTSPHHHQRLLSYMVSSLGATWPQGSSLPTWVGAEEAHHMTLKRGPQVSAPGSRAGLDSPSAPPRSSPSNPRQPQRKTLSSRHVGNSVRGGFQMDGGGGYREQTSAHEKVRVKLRNRASKKTKNKEKSKGKPRIITRLGARRNGSVAYATDGTYDGDGDGGELGPLSG
jgi:hypothetical protein